MPIRTISCLVRALTYSGQHGWDVVAEISDRDISGTNGRDHRPGLDRLQKRSASATARRAGKTAEPA